MNTETIITIAVVLAADLLFLLVFLKIRKKNREERLNIEMIAREGDWRTEPTTDPSELYRIRGELSTGIGWEMVARRSRASGSGGRHRTTTWSTGDVVLNGGVVALGPGMGINMETGDIDLGHSLIQAALRRMFGDELAAALADAYVIEIGPDEFSRRYSVFTDNEEVARRFLADPLPSILAEWRSEKLPFPGLVFWNRGMRIRFGEIANDPGEMRRIISLCGVLALRGREAAG